MSKSPRGGHRTHSIRERLTVDRKQRFASTRRHSHVTCGRVPTQMATRERRRMIRATRELRRGRGTVVLNQLGFTPLEI